MPRIIFLAAVWTIVTMIILLMLPNLLPDRKLLTYNDDELRKGALSKGMLPVPKDYSGLLKIKDNSEKLLTIEKIALGKELYFDTNLSKNGDISCATCHVISKDKKHHDSPLVNGLNDSSNSKVDCISCHLRDESGTERFSASVGEDGKEHPFHLNTQTILNSSLAKYLTWSGEVNSVEEQAGLSMQSPFKMAITPAQVEARLKKDSKYIKMFNDAFKDETASANDTVSFENTTKAIGAYVRTLLTRGAYDKFLDGNNSAISPEAKRGLTNFINFGCKGCHTGMSVGGQVIQRFPLKDFFIVEALGFSTPFISSSDVFPFENIGGYLGKDNEHLFRIPILRNVTKTSPYFHNGSVSNIREVVAIMGKHQLGLYLSETQIDEIVEFLKTLEGDVVDYSSDKQ